MDYLVAHFELTETKAGKDGPQFSGYVSTFGNIDAGADVVRPGAFDRTLKERSHRPLLWGHDQYTPPIGVEKSLVPDEKGLFGTWEMLDTSLGADVYKALKAGAVKTMSMGYVAIDAKYDGDVRQLLDVELLESSVVNIPMNEQAVITAVKSRHPDVDPPPTDSKETFDDHAARVLAGVDEFLARTKDLAALRADDGRKIGAAHFDRLRSLRAGVEELLALEDLPKGTPPMSGTRLRLELARRRARLDGITETRT